MSNNSPQRVRILKVEDVGDRHKNEVKLQIRLRGKWLFTAGILANSRVEITNPREGLLIVRCIRA